MSEISENPQYWAVVQAVGVVDLSRRGKVEVTGPDRVSFLHAMISNDVQELAVNGGRYATLLTAQGRMVADFYTYKLADSVLIDVDSALLEKLTSTLEHFIIMDDVILRDASGEWGHLSLQGPQAHRLSEKLKIPVPRQHLQVEEMKWKTSAGLSIRRGYLHPEGLDILLPREPARQLKEQLADQLGVVEVKAETFNLLRLERGIPLYGIDMDESHYPMEARLEHAVSLTKGCYIGQEVVAKATHIGGVNRLLCRLKMLNGEVPEAGSTLWVDDRKAGVLTSAALSPRAGTPIGLGYLRRVYARPGQQVRVEHGGQEIPAQVVDDFLAQE